MWKGVGCIPRLALERSLARIRPNWSEPWRDLYGAGKWPVRTSGGAPARYGYGSSMLTWDFPARDGAAPYRKMASNSWSIPCRLAGAPSVHVKENFTPLKKLEVCTHRELATCLRPQLAIG